MAASSSVESKMYTASYTRDTCRQSSLWSWSAPRRLPDAGGGMKDELFVRYEKPCNLTAPDGGRKARAFKGGEPLQHSNCAARAVCMGVAHTGSHPHTRSC